MGDSAPRQIYLEPGDPVADMNWRGPGGGRISLYQDNIAGRFVVLFVCASMETPGAARELARLAELHRQFDGLGALVFAVSADPVAVNAAAMRRLGLPFPILSDEGFWSGRALGIESAPAGPLSGPAAEPGGAGGLWCTLVVDPGRRVVKRIGPGGAAEHALAALAECTRRDALLTPGPGAVQAPVLIVPDVLDKAHCARLIQCWESGERYVGGVVSDAHGGNVPTAYVKVREDVVLPDSGAEAQELFGLFRRRVAPAIKQAFAFQVTRSESLRLGCYHAADGGHFIAHRDDTTPYSAHRRFAMSLALDSDAYEGGYVRFPEYGPQLFRAPTGAAVVFSVSMLHEVTRVTAGRRMILLGFFYSEAEEALRQKLATERHEAEAAAAAESES